MVHHPDDVKSEWMANIESTQQSKKRKIVLNYNGVYGALHRPSKRPKNLPQSQSQVKLVNIFLNT